MEHNYAIWLSTLLAEVKNPIMYSLFFPGGRKKGSRQNIPSISQTPPSQRRFSSEASVKLFSLTPGIRGKKLATVRTVHGATPLRKKPKLSKPKHSAELNLSTLSQAEVEYSKNASQNLSALLDADDMLWDS